MTDVLRPSSAMIPKRMTWNEYLAWDFEDCHAEWVDGEVVVPAADANCGEPSLGVPVQAHDAVRAESLAGARLCHDVPAAAARAAKRTSRRSPGWRRCLSARAEHAGATLEEQYSWWQEVFGVEVSRALTRLGWTRKESR